VRFAVTIVAVFLLAILLAVSRVAVKSYRAESLDFSHTPSTDLSQHPERTGISGLHSVAFPARGLAHIGAWYVPSRNTAGIVLIHGTEADRSALLHETRALAAAGFGVLAIDLPGQGESDGKSTWGVAERQAITSAGAWLSQQPDVNAERIGALGMSMGAYVLTQAATTDHRLRALILAGCPTDAVEQTRVEFSARGLLSEIPADLALRTSGMPLDMRPKDIVGGIAPRPVFLIAGELDRTVPPYMAQQLFAAAGDPKELWIVPGAHHADYGLVAPKEYDGRIVEFFTRTLLAPKSGN
jgi:dipeptidyl aminopeptidase/acylaminoacyl peptidase